MKSRITLLLFFFFLTSISFSRNIYVAKNGNDNNPGTEAQPYLTLSKAASVAVAGDKVIIRAGEYAETLRPANSGTAGNPITFESYPGEKVVITAMQPLSGWVSDGGQRYKTNVPWDLGQRNFVMRGTTAMDLARWPNNTDGDRFTLNSLRNDGGSQDEVSTNAFLTDADIPNWNWSNGGSVLFYGDRPGSGWTTWKAWIKSQSPGRINFDAIKNQGWIISAHPPGDKGDYYLEGIKEALDYENEWYFDGTTLYVILPGGAKPQDGEIKMARRQLTVNLDNRNHIHLRNLALFGAGVDIKGTGNTLYGVTCLYGSMTRGITPNFNSGVNAIDIDWACNNTTIENCEIGFGDGSGIWDSGKGTTIKNSYIHDFDFLGSYDAPVMIRGQSGAKLLNSTVTRGGRDALQIISKGSEVAYNDFSHSNLIADDCALLYTIGANLNMDIHHNWFHDAEGRGKLKKAAGIYLDNDAGDVRVYRNVVWNVEWTNVQINWNGTNIDIFNNTLAKADGGTMGAWHKAGTKFTNVKVWNNITDKEASDQGGNQETEVTWEPQSDKQNNLIDKTSFMDHANNDYRLKQSGPAVDFGRVINGYTDGFKGSAPDVGAYEVGDDWVPGVDWDIENGAAGLCYGLPGETCSGDGINPGDDINFATTQEVYPQGMTLDVPVNYTATGQRDILAILNAPNGTWLGNGRVTVASGSTVQTIPLQLANMPEIGTNYKLTVAIRAVGGDWDENIHFEERSIEIIAPFVCPDEEVYNECFESGTYSWGGWGTASKEVVPDDAHTGIFALRITGIGAANYTIDGLEPNTTYELSAFAKVVGDKGVNFGVKFFDDANSDLAAFTTNTDWEAKSLTFTTGANATSAQVYWYSPDAAGEGYLDDLSVKKQVITALDQATFSRLQAFPNPTAGLVELHSTQEIYHWTLRNVMGQEILEGEGKTVSLQEVPNGVYFIQVGPKVLRVRKL